MSLAGFDVVFELSAGFLEDLFLSRMRDILPGGDANDTFAPPFSWPMDFSAFGATGSALVIVQQVTLMPTADLRLSR